MTISTLIVDDEALARERVRTLLAPYPEFEVVGECPDGDEAVNAIETTPPDLLFLDIQMPGRDGFEVLRAVGPTRLKAVIFVTAYDQFAIRAFDHFALDYLLKPFTEHRFVQALDRARTWLSRHDTAELQRRMAAFLDERDTRVQRLMVREHGRITFVRVEEIDWIEAQGNYVRLHTGGRTHMLRDSLRELADRLDPSLFIRISRSAIVNLDRIREMTPLFHGEFLIVLHDGQELTSGRTFKSALEAAVMPRRDRSTGQS